jgi:anaerobic selenocysteine-containing dehydrogenase/Fe-S-cluster-containing dehydrogenase component
MSAQGISRRSFIKLAATASAAAAIPGCEPAARKLIPYVIPDDHVIPGVPAYYATVCGECPAGCGVVAKVREGRVIKLDGNPLDPISTGSICARGQAALQGVYNPDRLAKPQQRDGHGSLHDVSWDEAMRLFGDRLRDAAAKGRDRVAFIGAPQGPTLTKVIGAWLGAFNASRLVYYEAISDQPVQAAISRCFGRQDMPVYRIDRAEVVLSFGADFLETWGSPVEMSRQWASFRAPAKRRGVTTIGRSVYIGPRFSMTAAQSDEWIAARAGTEAEVALAVLHAMVNQGWVRPESGIDMAALKNFVSAYDPASVSVRTGVAAATISKMASWFGQADGALAIAGTDDKATHVACFILNAATGNVGRTMLFFNDAPMAPASPPSDVAALVDAMHNGAVDVLLVGGANPIFSMPTASGIVDALHKVPFVAWCGIVPDETAGMANLLMPINHPLESWGDATPRAGIHDFAQPTMDRVFDTRPLGDVLLTSAHAAGAAAGEKIAWTTTADAVEATFRDLYTARGGAGAGFMDSWQRVKQHGGLFEEPKLADVKLQGDAFRAVAPKPSAPAGELTLVAFPHIYFYDGRGADKPWLQEIPEPVSQFVWDSWVEIHPDTARRFGISGDDIVELATDHGVIEAPAHVSPRIHPDAIAVPIGQGHSAYGRYARGRGANPWRVLPADRMLASVKIRKTGERRKLVSPLGKSDMMGRSIVEAISLEELASGVIPAKEPLAPEPYEMYEQFKYPKHKWGMTIDVNACTGCGACIAACYAENNVPFVGKELVDSGRIMSWLRLERFFPESKDAPQIYATPYLCQQCDQAPCEPVCPVFAAYHTDEGLNGQIYNRCVGTRYCENNCPYKVRRFNWFKPEWPKPLDLQLNPDVTVRGAGVMEKCTFCVQRIIAAEIDARIEKRPVRDGEIIPACAQACPSHAIIFGDMDDKQSAMMRKRAENPARRYRSLEELNTKPAIVYLRDIYRRREKV